MYYLRTQEGLALRALDARKGEGAVRAVVLEGKPGVGKTALGRYYADVNGGTVEYYLCHHWSSDEDLFIGVDVGRVAAGVERAEDAYRPGVLLRAVQASHEGLVVVIVTLWEYWAVRARHPSWWRWMPVFPWAPGRIK